MYLKTGSAPNFQGFGSGKPFSFHQNVVSRHVSRDENLHHQDFKLKNIGSLEVTPEKEIKGKVQKEIKEVEKVLEKEPEKKQSFSFPEVKVPEFEKKKIAEKKFEKIEIDIKQVAFYFKGLVLLVIGKFYKKRSRF